MVHIGSDVKVEAAISHKAKQMPPLKFKWESLNVACAVAVRRSETEWTHVSKEQLVICSL